MFGLRVLSLDEPKDETEIENIWPLEEGATAPSSHLAFI